MRVRVWQRVLRGEGIRHTCPSALCDLVSSMTSTLDMAAPLRPSPHSLPTSSAQALCKGKYSSVFPISLVVSCLVSVPPKCQFLADYFHYGKNIVTVYYRIFMKHQNCVYSYFGTQIMSSRAVQMLRNN